MVEHGRVCVHGRMHWYVLNIPPSTAASGIVIDETILVSRTDPVPRSDGSRSALMRSTARELTVLPFNHRSVFIVIRARIYFY